MGASHAALVWAPATSCDATGSGSANATLRGVSPLAVEGDGTRASVGAAAAAASALPSALPAVPGHINYQLFVRNMVHEE
jgi:hypothetical protein